MFFFFDDFVFLDGLIAVKSKMKCSISMFIARVCAYILRVLKNLYKVNLLLQDGPLEVGQDCPSLIKVPVKTLDITWGNDTRFWQPVALTDHDKG